MLNKANFQEPDSKHRGVDLWMLNDKLEDAELERQIDEMHEKGCGAFIARTFFGLKSDYPGEDFMHKMGVIIGKAKEKGLKVFLQAGYMPGAVIGLRDEYTCNVIELVRDGDDCPANSVYIAENNGIRYYARPMKYYLDLLNPDAVSYYMEIAYEKIWARFSDEFGKTIPSVWVDEPHFDPTDEDIPLLDKPMQIRFI